MFGSGLLALKSKAKKKNNAKLGNTEQKNHLSAVKNVFLILLGFSYHPFQYFCSYIFMGFYLFI